MKSWTDWAKKVFATIVYKSVRIMMKLKERSEILHFYCVCVRQPYLIQPINSCSWVSDRHPGHKISDMTCSELNHTPCDITISWLPPIAPVSHVLDSPYVCCSLYYKRGETVLFMRSWPCNWVLQRHIHSQCWAVTAGPALSVPISGESSSVDTLTRTLSGRERIVITSVSW